MGTRQGTRNHPLTELIFFLLGGVIWRKGLLETLDDTLLYSKEKLDTVNSVVIIVFLVAACLGSRNKTDYNSYRPKVNGSWPTGGGILPSLCLGGSTIALDCSNRDSFLLGPIMMLWLRPKMDSWEG